MKALLLAAAASLSISLAPAHANPPAHPAPAKTVPAKKPAGPHCPPPAHHHHAAAHHIVMHKRWMKHWHHHWHKAWEPPAGDTYQEETAPPPPPPPPPQGPMPYDRWIDGYGRAYIGGRIHEGAPGQCPCPPNMHGPVPPECRFPVWKGYNHRDGLQNGY